MHLAAAPPASTPPAGGAVTGTAPAASVDPERHRGLSGLAPTAHGDGLGCHPRFRFDLYLDSHEGDVELPATTHHFLHVPLDTAVTADFASDGTAYRGPVRTGDVSLVPAHRTARWRWCGCNRACMHLFFEDAWLRDIGASESGADPASLDLRTVHRAADPVVHQVARTLRREVDAGSRPSALLAESAGTFLGMHLLRRYSTAGEPRRATAFRGGLAGWQLRRVLDHLAAHLDRAVGLAELAALVGLSPAHFCTAFRESTGLPPHRWQMRQRLERAKAMLADPRVPLTEVALACGYGGSSHFSTAFRKETGLTPSGYRCRL